MSELLEEFVARGSLRSGLRTRGYGKRPLLLRTIGLFPARDGSSALAVTFGQDPVKSSGFARSLILAHMGENNHSRLHRRPGLRWYRSGLHGSWR